MGRFSFLLYPLSADCNCDIIGCMKKLVALCVVALLSVEARAEYAFLQTSGPDCYADGSPLLSGECYAIVWFENGFYDYIAANGFEGLVTADGTIGFQEEDKDDSPFRIFQARPLARQKIENSEKIAYCPLGEDPLDQATYSRFQVPVLGHSTLQYDGRFAFMILDTRVVNEAGALTTNGSAGVAYSDDVRKLPAIQSYGILVDSKGEPIFVDFSGSVKDDTKRIPEDGRGTASVVAPLPEGCPSPVVSDVTVTNGIAEITVTNTAPYVIYALTGTNELAAAGHPNAVVGLRQGAQAVKGSIKWVVPAKEKQSFFKVIRKP